MKLQPDRHTSSNVIAGYTANSIAVADKLWQESLVLPWEGEVFAWGAAGFDQLDAAHFERIAALRPELVIFGSGSRIRFPRPEWLRSLIERGIGLETMDTGAACRTYNVLVGEGRSVVAALLIGT
jgi:uncharacterized protein